MTDGRAGAWLSIPYLSPVPTVGVPLAYPSQKAPQDAAPAPRPKAKAKARADGGSNGEPSDRSRKWSHQSGAVLCPPLPTRAPKESADQQDQLVGWLSGTFCTVDGPLQNVVHSRHGLLTSHLHGEEMLWPLLEAPHSVAHSCLDGMLY